MISSIFEKKPVIELNDFSVNHLISIENDKLTLEEVITNNKNIKVISILGEARKGKSTLLNTIISSYTRSNQTLFKTSKSLDHCTQGIDYLHIPELNIVFCDVQGLKVGNSANDPKLLLITYLMSDIIIFTQQQMLNKSVLETFSPLSSFLTYIDFEQLDRRNRKPELIFRISDFSLDGTPTENLHNLFVEHEDQSKNIIINMKRLFSNISAYHTNQLDRSESKMLDNLNFHGLLEFNDNGFGQFIENLNSHINKIKPNHLFSQWFRDLHEFIKLINDNKKIDFNKLDVYKLLTKDELNEYQKTLRKRYPDIFNDFIVNHTQFDYDTLISSRISIKNDISNEFKLKFSMVNDNLKKDMYDEIINDIDSKINTAIQSNRDQAYKLLFDFVVKQPYVDVVIINLNINSTSLPNEILKRFEQIEQFIINKDINNYTIKIYKEWKNAYIKEYTDYRIVMNTNQSDENNNYFYLVHEFTCKLANNIRNSILLNKDNIGFLQQSFDEVKSGLITKFTNELNNINANIYSISLKNILKYDNKFPTLNLDYKINQIDYKYDPIKDIYGNGLVYINNIDMKDVILKNYIIKKNQILRNPKLYDAYSLKSDVELSLKIATINKDICKFYEENINKTEVVNNFGNLRYLCIYIPIYQHKNKYLLPHVCKQLIKNKLIFVHNTHLYIQLNNKNYKFNSYNDLWSKIGARQHSNLECGISEFYMHSNYLGDFQKIFQSTIKELQIKRDNYIAYDRIIKETIKKQDAKRKKLMERYLERCHARKEVENTKPEVIDTIINNPETNTNTIVKPTQVKYKKKHIPSTLKRMVWDEYIGANVGNTKCMCCKTQEIRQIEFTCGHIIAEKEGGETNLKNLRPICSKCNLSMGIVNMTEFMSKYGFGKLD
jgi:5-methylcytosine-specific restriction endonuclease McrA